MTETTTTYNMMMDSRLNADRLNRFRGGQPHVSLLACTTQAGVEPAPIGGPPGGQQGARAIECPCSALRALTPLQYSLSAPTATTAETWALCAGWQTHSRVDTGATRI